MVDIKGKLIDFVFSDPQLDLWGAPFWVRFAYGPLFNPTIPSSWIVHAGCISVACIHPSRIF